MNSKLCPVPGCRATINVSDAMCGTCWSMVPSKSKQLVHSTRRTLRKGAPPTLADLNNFRGAIDLAIADVVARR